MYMLARVVLPQSTEVRVGGAESPSPATRVTSYNLEILVESSWDTVQYFNQSMKVLSNSIIVEGESQTQNIIRTSKPKNINNFFN